MTVFWSKSVVGTNRYWAFSTSRTFSSSSNRYIDEWLASVVKPAEFYEEKASAPKQRNYFYTIDLQGRVFLEETIPKNIATSLKNTKFLDFFFSRLRRIQPREEELLKEWNVSGDYPFVSPCGPELNFCRPADSAIVFHSLTDDNRVLVFGGSLEQVFLPEKLAISKETGRLYHELVPTMIDEKAKGPTPLHKSDRLEYGLIRSSVTVCLSDSIVPVNDESKILSGMEFIRAETGVSHPIKWLPDEARPGPWSMPFLEGME